MFVSLFLPGVKEVIITLVLDLVILDILTGQLLHVLNTSSYNKSQVFKWLHIRFVLFLCLDNNMIIHKEKDPEQVFNQQSSSRETKQVTFSWITSKSCIVDIFWSFGENTNNNNAEKMYWLVNPPKINCQNKKNNHLFSHLTVYIWNIWIFGSECTIMDVQVFLTHSFFTEQLQPWTWSHSIQQSKSHRVSSLGGSTWCYLVICQLVVRLNKLMRHRIFLCWHGLKNTCLSLINTDKLIV